MLTLLDLQPWQHFSQQLTFEEIMIDYALHRIKINQLMKESQKHLLKNEFNDAYETALQVLAESKLYANAIKSMIRDEQA